MHQDNGQVLQQNAYLRNGWACPPLSWSPQSACNAQAWHPVAMHEADKEGEYKKVQESIMWSIHLLPFLENLQ